MNNQSWFLDKVINDESLSSADFHFTLLRTVYAKNRLFAMRVMAISDYVKIEIDLMDYIFFA